MSKLSNFNEAHCAFMESALGKQKLAQWYTLLDAAIALEPLQ